MVLDPKPFEPTFASDVKVVTLKQPLLLLWVKLDCYGLKTS